MIILFNKPCACMRWSEFNLLRVWCETQFPDSLFTVQCLANSWEVIFLFSLTLVACWPRYFSACWPRYFSAILLMLARYGPKIIHIWFDVFRTVLRYTFLIVSDLFRSSSFVLETISLMLVTIICLYREINTFI